MKYMVQIALTPEAGIALEARPDGPGPTIERLLARFKPEAVYMTCSERMVVMFAELDTADVVELMIAGTELAGDYPLFTPVISGQDFGPIVGKAMPGAQKLVSG